MADGTIVSMMSQPIAMEYFFTAQISFLVNPQESVRSSADSSLEAQPLPNSLNFDEGVNRTKR
jgi:hypothetical protein